MSAIAKFAIAAIVGGIAIGALAAASVPRIPIAAAASSLAESDRAVPAATGDQGAAMPDYPAQMAPPIDDRSGEQTAYAPPENRDDEAGEANQAAPDAAAEDAAPPQDDRAAQAADAAREAAEDAKAAEAAPAEADGAPGASR